MQTVVAKTLPLALWNSRNHRVWPHHVVVFVLDDVAVVNIFLRREHAHRQIEFGPDPGEIAGVGFDRVLKTALCRVGRFLWSRRKWTRIVPAGDSIRALEGLLVSLDVEGVRPTTWKVTR